MYLKMNKHNNSDFNTEGIECIKCEEIDDFDILLSEHGKQLFELVNLVTMCGLIGLCGIAANIINIIVFCKQGFTSTVNIAFVGLAVSDLCCLIAVEWCGLSVNPRLPAYDVIWESVEVMYLTAALPHICFCRITCYITVYVTAERFISIAWPLKVKQIITHRRTSLIVCSIFIINVVAFIPMYATSYLDWRYIAQKNRTLVGIHFTNSGKDLEGICFVLHSLLFATSFAGVIIFTLLLFLKLRQTSEWRKGASTSHHVTTGSNKERKTGKMIVLIATVLIICYTPGAIIAMTQFMFAEFNIRGRYINICEAIWSVVYIFQTTNSSVNIFIYYSMSSKYRQTFSDSILKRARTPVHDID